MLHCYPGVNISRFSTMQKKQKQKPKRKKEKEKEDMYYNKHIVNVYFVIN